MRTLLWSLPLVAALCLGCRTNESPKAQVDDLQITAQVKSKLAADVGLSSITDISINATNGVVTLAGQVDSENLRIKAEATARSVPHVIRVINNLQIADRVRSQRGFPGEGATDTGAPPQPALRVYWTDRSALFSRRG